MYLTSSSCIDCGKCLRKCPSGAIRKGREGYYITCINCGLCASMCPSKAIRRNRYGGYYVDKSKCTGCGLCAAVCPVASIVMEGGFPRGICLMCGICAETCPKRARVHVQTKPGLDTILAVDEPDPYRKRPKPPPDYLTRRAT